MLVSLEKVMRYAEENELAVGAFDATNLESVVAILEAAEEMNQPVILSYAPGHSEFISLDTIGPIMVEMSKKAAVDVCVHLDHASSLELCVKAIRMGFTSVMYDASAKPYEVNLRETREIVNIAHSVGVGVEAELGHVFSSSIGAIETKEKAETAEDYDDLDDVYTSPAKAKEFVEATGVDALAVAFGTSHGVYLKKPVLDLNRITKIREQILVPLVMHGGSGLSRDEYKTAVRNGIRKINYYTYMTMAGGDAVRSFIESKKKNDKIFYHDISRLATEAMKENVKSAMALFQ